MQKKKYIEDETISAKLYPLFFKGVFAEIEGRTIIILNSVMELTGVYDYKLSFFKTDSGITVNFTQSSPIVVPSTGISVEEFALITPLSVQNFGFYELRQNLVGKRDDASLSGTGEVFNSYNDNSRLSNRALGFHSHAEGFETTASGACSHAEGQWTRAIGNYSHAEGQSTSAIGVFSHTEGTNTEANGEQSHAEGHDTIADGDNSHAEGQGTIASGMASHAEGSGTKANGTYSHVEGSASIASGAYSHAEGCQTVANGRSSHAEGCYTKANGETSHAEGSGTTAGSIASHAEGYATNANGVSSHAEGDRTQALEEGSHAEGSQSQAVGIYSHAENFVTYAYGLASHSEGAQTVASGMCSHVEGNGTIAMNNGEHAQGIYNVSHSGTVASAQTLHSIGIGTGLVDDERKNAFEVMANGDIYVYGLGNYDGRNIYSAETLQVVAGVGRIDPNSPSGTGQLFGNYSMNRAVGEYSHAEGSAAFAHGFCAHAEGLFSVMASGIASHAEGFGTQAMGNHSHTEGTATKSYGASSHAEGSNTITSGDSSHAEGTYTVAEGESSHAEGSGTTASGMASHAEGFHTQANGADSHAEGYYTSAINSSSHAEGRYTEAYGQGSHAEGFHTQANGADSHAEGYYTQANGQDSHAEGWFTQANGMASHAQNFYTTSSGRAVTSMGQYNKTNSNTSYTSTNIALSIGNGTSNTNRGNAFTVQFNGSVKGDMSYSTPAADYAEMFEWEDGNPDNEDRVGYFVTVSGKKIRKATSSDEIVGIVSSTPGVIGNNPMRWNNKYANDEWGRPIYEEVEVPYTKMVEQEDGTMKEETVYQTEVHRKLNPEWRGEESYTDRTDRKEWSAVGLLGQILVRQDGTLEVGNKCVSNDNGIATKSDKGYIVLEIPNESQALILFK